MKKIRAIGIGIAVAIAISIIGYTMSPINNESPTNDLNPDESTEIKPTGKNYTIELRENVGVSGNP